MSFGGQHEPSVTIKKHMLAPERNGADHQAVPRKPTSAISLHLKKRQAGKDIPPFAQGRLDNHHHRHHRRPRYFHPRCRQPPKLLIILITTTIKHLLRCSLHHPQTRPTERTAATAPKFSRPRRRLRLIITNVTTTSKIFTAIMIFALYSTTT